MIKSKVIDVFKKLTKDELKELNDFVNSPYHNKNKNVIALFAELKKHFPDFENRNLTKENVYSKIFPGKVYADKTFRNLMSDIFSLIEKYLIVKNTSKKTLLTKYILIESLAEKNLHKAAEHNIREADIIYDDILFDGGNVFYLKHLVEMEKDFIEISKNKNIDLNMKEGEYLIYSFLSKYMVFKMKSANYRYKQQSEKTSEFIKEFENRVNFDKWIQYLELKGGFESEIILTYYYTVRFMTDLSDSTSFNKALTLFYKNKSRIDTTETTNLYLTFTGYCTVKMSRGEKEYTQILFELYSKMFQENLLIGEKEQYLHITIFNNVVATALLLGKTEWVKVFIEEYSPRLLPEFRDTMYNYACARYCFAVNEFSKSLEHLSRVGMENFWLKSRTRILQLRIYYELGYVEAFFSLLDAIKHSFKTDKQMPSNEKENDYNFIYIMGRLAKIKFSLGTESAEEIKKDARNTLKGQLKEWILLKISEIS